MGTLNQVPDTAVDAVLATAITLTVVEPTGNGVGSDAFAILWDGSKLHGLNASGRSPEGWTLDRFKGRTTMPTKGWDAVTVPGAVSAWAASFRSSVQTLRGTSHSTADVVMMGAAR
jgi:gamma-glutamyltranspeptidase / glutathione hydrolase